MARVGTALSVSADGFIAGCDDGPGRPLGEGGERLFDWYRDGEVESRVLPGLRLSAPSAELFDAYAGRVGAIVCGRRTYDVARGWGGDGPLPGLPVVCLTHRDAPSQAGVRHAFTDGGVVDAIDSARGLAGSSGRDVALMGASVVQQALRAGILDDLVLHLVPVLLGAGVRLLDGVTGRLRLTRVLAAPGVTHLVHEVVR